MYTCMNWSFVETIKGFLCNTQFQTKTLLNKTRSLLLFFHKVNFCTAKSQHRLMNHWISESLMKSAFKPRSKKGIYIRNSKFFPHNFSPPFIFHDVFSSQNFSHLCFTVTTGNTQLYPPPLLPEAVRLKYRHHWITHISHFHGIPKVSS